MPNLVEIIVKSVDESAPGMVSAERKAKESGTRAGRNFSEGMKPSIMGVGKMLAGAFAITEGIEIFKGLIERGEQAERTAGLVEAAVKSTGGAAHVSAEQVSELARSISEKTGKDELAIQSGDAMLLTFRNIRNVAGQNNDIFNQATSVLTDMTAAMHGGDVSSDAMRKQAIQLGKALNDPIKGMTALRRVGVQFSVGQQQQIKDLVNSGHQLEAQKLILRELTTEFGGAAARSSTAIDRIKNSFQLLEDDLVRAFAPAITTGTQALDGLIQGLAHGQRVAQEQDKPGGIVGFLNTMAMDAHASAEKTFQIARAVDKSAESFTNWIPGGKAVNHFLDGLQGKSGKAKTELGGLNETVDTSTSKYADLIHPAGEANKSIFKTGKNAEDAAPKVQSLRDQVQLLKDAQFQLGAAIKWDQLIIQQKNDAQALSKALDKSKNSVGNHTQKQRDAQGTAITYINDLLQTAIAAGKNREKQDEVRQAIERVLPKLERAHDKTAGYKDAVQKLKDMLQQLARVPDIHESIFMRGKGTWGIFGKNPVNSGLFNAPGSASGRYINVGSGSTADDVLAPVSRGEVIVPANMVSSGAVDHLSGKIPGFAKGGIVGNYTGGIGAGFRDWTSHNWNASLGLISNSMANAIHKAFQNSMNRMMSFPGGGALGGSAAANRRIAMRMFPWPSFMFPAFNSLEMAEAGYSLTARNPSSGAYGMAQFINGPSEYYQYGGNPFTAGGQLTGMFNYIRQRYGNPNNAWAHELGFHWYDKGGFLPTGLSLAYNGTGSPEPVGPAAGSHVSIHFGSGGGGDWDQFMMDWIRDRVQVYGGGDVQDAFGA